MTPKISILVPIYNVEKYIFQCLDSLISQTFSDIEILCVDDCGTDNSMHIVEQYAQKDPRIHILHHSHNQGLSASRNTALSQAKAPYIMCCDSDDYYEPTMCEKLYHAITEHPVDMAICGTQIHYEIDEERKKDDNEYYRIPFNGTVEVNDQVLNETDVSAWNKIYKKEIFLKHQITWPTGLKYEDAYVFYTYTCWINSIYFLPEKLYNYRRRIGSIMNQTFQANTPFALDHLKIAFVLFDYYKKHNLYEKHLERYWQALAKYAYFAYYHTDGQHKKTVTTMLQNWISEHPIPSTLPDDLKQKFQHLLAPYHFTPYKTYLGGFLVKERNQFQKRYKLLGMTIRIKNR